MAAGVTRFRPVLMTALAMIIGMAPMALGFGEGGEQNAPLGRAVIGACSAPRRHAHFLPGVFSVLHRKTKKREPYERSRDREVVIMARRATHGGEGWMNFDAALWRTLQRAVVAFMHHWPDVGVNPAAAR